jgi:hypothetical protein
MGRKRWEMSIGSEVRRWGKIVERKGERRDSIE